MSLGVPNVDKVILTSIASFPFNFFTDFRENIMAFSTKLKINIPDINHLLGAFTHESYLIANANKLSGPHECNERLAFLGKALT